MDREVSRRIRAKAPETFYLCELSQKKWAALDQLAEANRGPNREISVYKEDFNQAVHAILGSGTIKESTATFCLLDQRTFECAWSSVEAVSRAKTGMKIEQFYFVPTGWLQRSLAALRKSKTALDWWGRDNWEELKAISAQDCANRFCARFTKELGYKYAHAWPIYERKEGRRVMYYMVHATDHEEAPKLMNRAYNGATGQLQEHQLFLNLPTPGS